MINKLLFLLSFILFVNFANGQKEYGPTDTLMLKAFLDLPGNAVTLPYSYTNGEGYFFGTNLLDLDRNPSTPREPGAQQIAQGFKLANNESHYILEVLVRVGAKVKKSHSGTPLILSIQYLDETSAYTINTNNGPVSHSVNCPGTVLASTDIAWNDLVTGATNNYSVGHFNTPIYVDQDFCITADLADFYWNGDKIGLMASPPSGASRINGKEYTLWLFPNPDQWIQVTHIFTTIDRSIAIFPVVDNGTYGIESPTFLQGLKLGSAYPNPASQHVNIPYALESKSDVKFEIIDSKGQVIDLIEMGIQTSGEHEFKYNTSNLASGIYYYTIYTDNTHLTKRFIIE